MVDLLDQVEKQKARLLREADERAQAETRERQRKAKLAKAVEALKTRQAVLIGETIRDADLSDAEKAMIAAILARRASPPKDWRLLADWLPAPKPVTGDQAA